MKQQEKLWNVYLSNLAVLNVKLHNLHWNVVGIHFKALHEFTEALYDSLFESYDSVAEMLKMRGLYPVANLKGYLELATVEELPTDSTFHDKEVLEILVKDLNTLKEQATELRNLADEAGDFTAVSYFEDQVSFLDKELWFLDAMKK